MTVFLQRRHTCTWTNKHKNAYKKKQMDNCTYVDVAHESVMYLTVQKNVDQQERCCWRHFSVWCELTLVYIEEDELKWRQFWAFCHRCSPPSVYTDSTFTRTSAVTFNASFAEMYVFVRYRVTSSQIDQLMPGHFFKMAHWVHNGSLWALRVTK